MTPTYLERGSSRITSSKSAKASSFCLLAIRAMARLSKIASGSRRFAAQRKGPPEADGPFVAFSVLHRASGRCPATTQDEADEPHATEAQQSDNAAGFGNGSRFHRNLPIVVLVKG